TTDEDYSKILPSLKRPHLDYMRDFYGDTALFGGGIHAVRCGLEFFGAEHVVFATDTPLGPIAPTIDVINRLDIADGDRRKIFAGNAERLLKRKFSCDQETGHVNERAVALLYRGDAFARGRRFDPGRGRRRDAAGRQGGARGVLVRAPRHRHAQRLVREQWARHRVDRLYRRRAHAAGDGVRQSRRRARLRPGDGVHRQGGADQGRRRPGPTPPFAG